MIITRYGGQTWLNRRVTPISSGRGIDNHHILWYHILVDTTGGRCIEYASGLMCRTMPPECYRVSYFSHALLTVVLTFSHCQVLRFSFQPRTIWRPRAGISPHLVVCRSSILRGGDQYQQREGGYGAAPLHYSEGVHMENRKLIRIQKDNNLNEEIGRAHV